MATVSRALRRIKQDLQPFLSDQDILDACRPGRPPLAKTPAGPGHHHPPVRPADPALQHRHESPAASGQDAGQGRPPSARPAAAAAGGAAAPAGQDRRGRPIRLIRRRPGRACGPTWSMAPARSARTCPALQKAFGQPKPQKPGCGFPVPKLLGLFDAFSGLIQELLVAPAVYRTT